MVDNNKTRQYVLKQASIMKCVMTNCANSGSCIHRDYDNHQFLIAPAVKYNLKM